MICLMKEKNENSEQKQKLSDEELKEATGGANINGFMDYFDKKEDAALRGGRRCR